MRCQNYSQNCHGIPNDLAKRCADRKGYEMKQTVICFNFGGWKHFPNSPWGDIDICAHGVTREHGDTTNPCRFCENPEVVETELY